MDIKQLAAQVASTLTAPTNYGANVNDAGGNAQVTQNIRNLGSLDAKGNAASRATGALGTVNNVQAQADADAAKAAAQKKNDDAQALADQIKQLSDPKNYKAIINDAGGYDFTNPTGDKISAVDYAKATNQHITDIYKNSQDPNDKDFTGDYNRVLELGKILNSGDKKARDKFYKDNPDWKTAYGNSTYNDVVKDLRNEYPGYFRSDKELTDPNNFQGATLQGKDERNFAGRAIDQLIPSFLGNKNTYKTRY